MNLLILYFIIFLDTMKSITFSVILQMNFIDFNVDGKAIIKLIFKTHGNCFHWINKFPALLWTHEKSMLWSRSETACLENYNEPVYFHLLVWDKRGKSVKSK